jgi:hypothetical protein
VCLGLGAAPAGVCGSWSRGGCLPESLPVSLPGPLKAGWGAALAVSCPFRVGYEARFCDARSIDAW